MASQLFNVYPGDGSYNTTYNKLKTQSDDVNNSLVFNTSRHSIWAKGIEYGYSLLPSIDNGTVSNVVGTTTDNDGASKARKYISGISLSTDNDKMIISYTYGYESALSVASGTGNFVYATTVSGHTITNSYGTFSYNGTKGSDATLTTTNTLNVLTGVKIDSTGQVSYSYSKINVTNDAITNTGYEKTTEQNHVITNVYISSTGDFSYDYRDISGSDSGNFLTGFSQTADGKVSVTKGSFNTGAGTGSSTNVIVNSVNIDSTGKLTYTLRNDTIGTSTRPIYLSNGSLTTLGTMGNASMPIYLSNGSLRTLGTVGTSTRPIYLSNGSLTTLGTMGNASSPIYLSNGSLTTLGTVGTSTRPIYLSNGSLTTLGTMGNASSPIYLSNGSLTTLGTVGNASTAIYLSNGVFQTASTTVSFDSLSQTVTPSFTKGLFIKIGSTIQTIDSLNADLWDDYHLVVGSTPGTDANTIYVVI